MAFSRHFGRAVEPVMDGGMHSFIRHIEVQLVLQPRADTLIALKAFWPREFLAQLGHRLALKARFFAPATPMTGHEGLKAFLFIWGEPALTRFAFDMSGLGNRFSCLAIAHPGQKECMNTIPSFTVMERI